MKEPSRDLCPSITARDEVFLKTNISSDYAFNTTVVSSYCKATEEGHEHKPSESQQSISQTSTETFEMRRQLPIQLLLCDSREAEPKTPQDDSTISSISSIHTHVTECGCKRMSYTHSHPYDGLHFHSSTEQKCSGSISSDDEHSYIHSPQFDQWGQSLQSSHSRCRCQSSPPASRASSPCGHHHHHHHHQHPHHHSSEEISSDAETRAIEKNPVLLPRFCSPHSLHRANGELQTQQQSQQQQEHQEHMVTMSLLNLAHRCSVHSATAPNVSSSTSEYHFVESGATNSSTTSPSKVNIAHQNQPQAMGTAPEPRMRGWNFRRKHHSGSKVPNPHLLALTKQALKDRQMKQKVLASHLGVSESTVSKYLHQNVKPNGWGVFEKKLRMWLICNEYLVEEDTVPSPFSVKLPISPGAVPHAIANTQLSCANALSSSSSLFQPQQQQHQ